MTTREYKANFDKIDWSKPMTRMKKRPYTCPSKRSRLDFPQIISDHMEAMRHPATGLWADSKSAFRAMTKASGCVEIGNEDPAKIAKRDRPKHDRRKTVEAIKGALRQKGVDIL